MLNTKLDSALLMDILERQSNPIVRVDCKNRLLYINKSSANLFGLGVKYKVGSDFLSYMKKEDALAFEKAYTEARSTKLPTKATQKLHTKNGWIWMEWEITPIFDEEGEVREIQSIGQNASSLMATQDALNLVFQALEQTSSAVAITDRNGAIVFINQKFEKLYGYTKKEAIGKTPRILKSELTSPEVFVDMWRKILSGEGIFGHRIVNKTKLNQLKWVLLSIIPIKNDSGIITHFVGINEDVGFQKELKKQFKKAKFELEEINQALEREVDARTRELRQSNMLLQEQMEELKKMEAEKESREQLLAQQSKLASFGEMINMIAHQWRQPLTAISAAGINLKTKQALGELDDEKLDVTLDEILHYTQKMSATINDFLNFFKPSKEKEHFTISTAEKDTLELIGAQLISRGICIEHTTNCNVVVYGFKNELEQVLINIISNARDAFENSSEENKLINISCGVDDEYLLIEICDNAGGVEETIIDRLFEPYFTTKKNGQGTGIGLYMSKMIIQKSFDGDIYIKNIYQDDNRIGLCCQIKIKYGEAK